MTEQPGILGDHRDVQVHVAVEVLESVCEGATELCLREPECRVDAARALMCEHAIVNLIVFMVARCGLSDIEQKLKYLVQRAQYALDSGTYQEGVLMQDAQVSDPAVELSALPVALVPEDSATAAQMPALQEQLLEPTEAGSQDTGGDREGERGG